MKKHLKILIPLLLCILISSLVIIFGKYNYSTINTPKFSPPNYVFIIVWSVVYSLLYYTMYICLDSKKIYIQYLFILIAHTLWNILFFIFGYFLVSLILLFIIYFLSFVFVYFISQIKKKLFYVNLVYLIWLMIAIYLNFGVVLLN